MHLKSMFLTSQKEIAQMNKIQITKIEKPSDYEMLGNAVKKVISEKGVECLADTESFISSLKEKKIDFVVAMQLGLLLEAGNIKNYLTQVKTGITMIDVNNMVTCAEAETGLSKKKIKYLLTVMLYGLSLPTEIASVHIPTDTGYELVDKALVNQTKYISVLQTLREAIENNNEETIAKNATAFETMVKAGLPEALYLKALCYINGIATEKDSAVGFRYMAAAANAGVAEANAYLGDFYFENATYEDFSKAFNYYTQLGAVALSKERKHNLKVVVAAKRQNITQIILNGILLIAIFFFNSHIGKGTFSLNGATHWGWAITSDILVSMVYALQIVQFVLTKYNRTKWATVGIFVILALTTVFAL